MPAATGTSLEAVLCFVIAAAIGALGQFLYKTGADRANDGLISYLLNAPLAGGVVCYILVMLLFVRGFKAGGALTVLYPVYASTFIWAALLAWYRFGTPIKPANVCGMVLLVAGMYLMGR